MMRTKVRRSACGSVLGPSALRRATASCSERPWETNFEEPPSMLTPGQRERNTRRGARPIPHWCRAGNPSCSPVPTDDDEIGPRFLCNPEKLGIDARAQSEENAGIEVGGIYPAD